MVARVPQRRTVAPTWRERHLGSIAAIEPSSGTPGCLAAGLVRGDMGPVAAPGRVAELSSTSARGVDEHAGALIGEARAEAGYTEGLSHGQDVARMLDVVSSWRRRTGPESGGSPSDQYQPATPGVGWIPTFGAVSPSRAFKSVTTRSVLSVARIARNAARSVRARSTDGEDRRPCILRFASVSRAARSSTVCSASRVLTPATVFTKSVAAAPLR